MTVGASRQRDRSVGATASRLGLRAAFGRLRAALRPDPEGARLARLRCLADVSAALEGARSTLVEHGWVQNTWYAVQRRSPTTTSPDATDATDAPEVPGVPGACLVGAVVRATRRHHPAAGATDAGPALDVLWDALQESRGLHGPGLAGRAVPREIRTARVRDLTRWNDDPGRSRDEVLGLLDLATSRAIMEAVHLPQRVPAPASR
jgi:hypothetical protein